jgi:AsmA protein
MRRRRTATWAGVVVVTAAVAAFGFAPWPLSPKRVEESLNAAFAGSASARWSTPASATFRALPWPSLRIVDARLDDASGVTLVSAPEARLDLSLAGLLEGRLKPVRAALLTPTMTFDLDRLPGPGKDVEAEAASAAAAFAPLAGLTLMNGVIRLFSKQRGLDTVIENVQGRLDGLSAGERMRINLSALWRETPIAMSVSLANPERAARGAPSEFQLALASPIANVSFHGALAGGLAASVAGDLAASVPSLAALARIFGIDRQSFIAADDVEIVGKLGASPDEVTLSEATLTSAGQTLQGGLHVEGVGGRPAVSGSFDADRLAIARLMGPAPTLVDSDGNWSARSFAIAPPRNFDLDLRFSAGRLDVYGRDLASAAASVILKDGVVTASLVDASAYGGRLRGETRIACTGEDLSIRAAATLAGADFGAAFSDFGWPVPTGQGTLEIALETTGRSPVEAVSGLGGSAALKLEQGAVSGVNLEEALRRSLRRPIDVARDMRIGDTAFDKLALKVALGHGIVHIVNGDLAAHGLAADLQGQIDLSAQNWDLRANAMQIDGAGQGSKDGARLSFDIQGPWSSPMIRARGEKEDAQPAQEKESPLGP